VGRFKRVLPADTNIVEFFLALPPDARAVALAQLGFDEADAFDRDWGSWVHPGQFAPAGDWSTWVVMGGRGFGKTRAGAEWVRSLIAGGAALRIALVAATRQEARAVMVEGQSGLLAVAEPYVDEWFPGRGVLRFRGGAEAALFSGTTPDFLRGPEHHFAWCDELAKWRHGQECWDMLRLGLRLGERPRALITTTPRPGPVLSGIIDAPGTIQTGGPTARNPHNARAFTAHVYARYAGTRLALQELEGQLLTDAPGALWTVELLESCRLQLSPSSSGEGFGVGDVAVHDPSGMAAAGQQAPPPSPPLKGRGEVFSRLVIAVDPPTGDGTCGIVACARTGYGEAAHAHVLADHSVTARSPEGWARAVADAAAMWSALHPHLPRGVEVVAESNQGGRMVGAVLRTADPRLKVRRVDAVAGKADRAAPVAMLFEAGKVTLHGRFADLEPQLLGLIAGGGYEGPGSSPDRADAMVWGLTELMLKPERAPPRVRGF
jgi:phage terminase large subunit-like protein